MTRAFQTLVLLYFLCAGLFGALGMIYAHDRTQFAAAFFMSIVSLYSLLVIRRFERSAR